MPPTKPKVSAGDIDSCRGESSDTVDRAGLASGTNSPLNIQVAIFMIEHVRSLKREGGSYYLQMVGYQATLGQLHVLFKDSGVLIVM